MYSCLMQINKLNRKGIILAGGFGKRLYPITKSISKQLISVYDKPMIYYPLSTLMLCGIREILIITNPIHKESFQNLLGNGERFGIEIKYAIQNKPEGLAQAFIIGHEFVGDSPSVLILGDNLFHGSDFHQNFDLSNIKEEGATIFSCSVSNPQDYGVIYLNENQEPYKIEEKPVNSKSKDAITGIYFYDNSVINKAKKVIPSPRGELEISSINQMYLDDNKLFVKRLNRGFAWLDTGTVDSLHEASSYIRTLEKRQGRKIGCPEEVAWRQNWISSQHLMQIANEQIDSGYGEYLINVIKEEDSNIIE